MANYSEFRESNIKFKNVNYCKFYGDNCTIIGNYNDIYGNNCKVYGSYNNFYGNNNVLVEGNYNSNHCRNINYFSGGSGNTGFYISGGFATKLSTDNDPVQKYDSPDHPINFNNLYVNCVGVRQVTVQQPARSASLLASPEPKRAKEPKDMTTDDKLEELLSNDITKGKIQNLQNLHKEKLNEYQLELDDALDSSIKFLYNKYVTEEKERQKIEAENLMKAAKEAEEKKKIEEERRKNKDKESEMEIMLKFLAEKMNKDKEVVIV